MLRRDFWRKLVLGAAAFLPIGLPGQAWAKPLTRKWPLLCTEQDAVNAWWGVVSGERPAGTVRLASCATCGERAAARSAKYRARRGADAPRRS